VCVTGPVNPETGMVVDLKELSEIIRYHVVDVLDHKNLNLDIPEFKELIPTTENLSYYIYQKLLPHIPSHLTFYIELYETSRNYVRYPV
jgi:6-pyruvoyltetrahydropterin/6-carboxytetrahydropterin synthase